MALEEQKYSLFLEVIFHFVNEGTGKKPVGRDGKKVYLQREAERTVEERTMWAPDTPRFPSSCPVRATLSPSYS